VLADIIAGRPEVEGLAVYRVLGAALSRVALREIDLSDNALGPKGVDACRELLGGQASLERLFCCNVGLSAEAARSVADLLLFRSPTQLRALHFCNNMSGSGGAIAIADVVAASPALEDFRFASSRGGAEGGCALARALGSCAGALQALDLEDNTFQPRGARALGALLAQAPRLRRLNLGDIAAGDEGAAAIARGLAAAGGPRACLAELSLASNELSAPAGARALARCLRVLLALRQLDAGDNPELGDAGARTLARALLARARCRPAEAPADPLARLRLADCGLTGKGALALLAACLAAAPQLTVLDLTGNTTISRAGCARLRAAAAGTRIEILGLDEDEADEDDSDEGEEDEEEEEEERQQEAEDEEADKEGVCVGGAERGRRARVTERAARTCDHKDAALTHLSPYHHLQTWRRLLCHKRRRGKRRTSPRSPPHSRVLSSCSAGSLRELVLGAHDSVPGAERKDERQPLLFRHRPLPSPPHQSIMPPYLPIVKLATRPALKVVETWRGRKLRLMALYLRSAVTRRSGRYVLDSALICASASLAPLSALETPAATREMVLLSAPSWMSTVGCASEYL